MDVLPQKRLLVRLEPLVSTARESLTSKTLLGRKGKEIGSIRMKVE